MDKFVAPILIILVSILYYVFDDLGPGKKFLFVALPALMINFLIFKYCFKAEDKQ